MTTGILVVDDLRAAEDVTAAKPTALLLASSSRAETWRYVFGSTTVPIKSMMPRQTILPGIGPAFVLDVDVSRLDAGQIDRAAETISKRFDVPIDEARHDILGEHGLPIRCHELATTTLRFCDGCNADLGALAPHADACEYQRPCSQPEEKAWHIWFDVDVRKRSSATTESIALVANANGKGVVLAFDGLGIESMIDGVGREIDNLGLDDGPSGISIWEGECRSHRDGDDDAELVGAFRALTPEEWQRLATTGVPWAFEENGED